MSRWGVDGGWLGLRGDQTKRLAILSSVAVLVGAILVLFLAASWVRRWAKQADEPAGAGFTLGDLRALHRAGKMSTEEYEKAKPAVIERWVQSLAKESSAISAGNIKRMVVFRATGPGDTVPASCAAGSPSTGLCNVYYPSDFAAELLLSLCPSRRPRDDPSPARRPLRTESPSRSWCRGSRDRGRSCTTRRSTDRPRRARSRSGRSGGCSHTR